MQIEVVRVKGMGCVRVYLTLATLLIGVARAQINPPSFLARTDYFASGPNGIVIGDVNNDGIPDIVADGAIVPGGTFVFLGNGDGTFRPVVQPNVNGAVISEYRSASTKSANILALADVNRDGNLDIIATSPSTKIYVILGNGDGTFQNPDTITTIYDAPGPVYSLAVADLNNDGFPDIAAGSTGLTLLTNNGDGTFQETAEYLKGDSVGAITIRDINGDRVPDLAVGVGTDRVQFLLGTGGGKFRSGSSLSSPTVPGALFFADFNGDGIFDLAVGGNVWVHSSTQVTIFPGTGGGNFGAPRAALTFPLIAQLAVGDINDDGFPDIVTIEDKPDPIAVYINNGDGTFAAPRRYSCVGGAVDIAVAPLRKPGLADIVVAGSLGFDISVLLNEGAGTFQDGLHIPLSAEPGRIVAADFNHNGLDDLAVITSAGVQIFHATGETLTPFSSGALVALPATSLVAGDFNNDGVLDLAMGLSTNQIAVVFGNGDGTFEAPIYSVPGGVSTNEPLLVWVGDFNGDGKLDLATSFNSYLLGNGDGTFRTPSPILPPKTISTYGPITAIGAGDLDGDGIVDMIVSLNADSAYVFSVLGSTKGELTQVGPTYSYNFGLIEIVVADVNGDGIPDVVVSSIDGAGYFLGSGGGLLQPTAIELGDSPIYTYAIAVADFNDDGIPDIAVSTDEQGSIALYTGTGGGSFSGPAYLGTAAGSTWVISGCFHRTRTKNPDLAVPALDGIDILLNTTK